MLVFPQQMFMVSVTLTLERKQEEKLFSRTPLREEAEDKSRVLESTQPGSFSLDC